MQEVEGISCTEQYKMLSQELELSAVSEHINTLPRMILINKIDSDYHREQKEADINELKEITSLPILYTSALNNIGTDELKERLYEHFFGSQDI